MVTGNLKHFLNSFRSTPGQRLKEPFQFVVEFLAAGDGVGDFGP
jgi:hypothetical protein